MPDPRIVTFVAKHCRASHPMAFRVKCANAKCTNGVRPKRLPTANGQRWQPLDVTYSKTKMGYVALAHKRLNSFLFYCNIVMLRNSPSEHYHDPSMGRRKPARCFDVCNLPSHLRIRIEATGLAMPLVPNHRTHGVSSQNRRKMSTRFGSSVGYSANIGTFHWDRRSLGHCETAR